MIISQRVNNYKMIQQSYRPYYSARHVLPPPPQPPQQDQPPQHLHNIELQRRHIDDVVREREEFIHNERLKEYKESLRLKQTAIHKNENKQQSKVKFEKESIYKYYQQLEEKLKQTRSKRQSLEQNSQYQSNYADYNTIKHQNQSQSRRNQSIFQKNIGSKIPIFDRSRQTLSQIQYNNQIESERVIQQYQQELLDKINAKDQKRKKSKSNPYQNNISAKYKLEDVAGGQNIIINKRSIEAKSDEQTNLQNRTTSQKETIQNQLQKPANNRALNIETIKIDETIKKKSKTIDISQVQQHFLKHKYKTINSKKTKKKSQNVANNHFYSQCKHNNKKAQFSRKIAGDQSASTRTGYLQRIQNRLKVSVIVFKDSQLKNNRYEANHLQNTYETQIRLRKEVKDKINNHPTVLSKHNMVVASR